MGVQLQVRNFRCFTDGSPLTLPIGARNVAIVGENNAGKTAALKFFAEFEGLWPILLNGLGQANANANFGIQPRYVEDPLEIFTDENRRAISIEFSLPVIPTTTCISKLEAILHRGTFHANLFLYDGSGARIPNVAGFSGDDSIAANGNYYAATGLLQALQRLVNVKYIPAARITAHPLGPLESNFVSGPALVSLWNDWKNGVHKTQAQSAIDLEMRLADMFGFRSLQINSANDGQTLSLIVDGRRRRVREIGSGFLQIFSVLVSVFSTGPSPLVLLDEPENGLHPRLQAKFLELLGELSSGVLFATHNVGLARTFADEVVTLQRMPSSEVKCGRLQAVRNLAEFLGEMSFSAYRELGIKRLLLVEGQTDKPAIEVLLQRFFHQHDIAVFPLFGETLVSDAANAEASLAEFSRMADEVFVIIDSERADVSDTISARRAKFLTKCEQLGYIAMALERRALENYFSDDAVKQVFGSQGTSLQPHERLDRSRPYWGKHKNVDLARVERSENLQATDLWSALSKLAN